MPEPNTRPPRRERQMAARLEQILDAAAHLFAERGFHRTTTRDIAEAADVAEGTLYNYFETKNDLLFAILSRLSESELPQAGLVPGAAGPVQISAGDARQHFASLLNLRREYIDENSVMLQAILSEILANADLRQRYAEQLLTPTLNGLEKELTLRIKLGQFQDLDVPATARVLTSVWIGLFILQLLEDPQKQPDWERLAQATIHIVFDGIAPPLAMPDKSGKPGQ
jgi:TetR/AcrR family transcriptional regulator, fatty acid metabolism regulator protein